MSKSDTDRNNKKLGFAGLVRELEDYISERLNDFGQNNHNVLTANLIKEVDGIMKKLNDLVIGRCQTLLIRGKNKGRRCLRASTGDKCRFHSGEKKSSKKDPGFSESTQNTSTNLELPSPSMTLSSNLDLFPNPSEGIETKPPLQQYIKDPSKELQHIYGNVYLDSMNTVVINSEKPPGDYQWILAGKFDRKLGVIKEFSKSIIVELVKQKSVNRYDYIVDESNIYSYKVNVNKILQFIIDSDLRKAPLREEQSSTAASNTLSTKYINSNIITATDKAKYYNKYSRAPMIKLDNEEMMSASEFTQFYRKQHSNNQPSKEKSARDRKSSLGT
ncbi:hypothetical protein CONCODRAFT_167611 [Conidiobolus coronatus NRRL 28638]|uniref:Uncharacterized protein n=1 Tax=Conidiobolus coronatus (strain ATCC 28846 / CBS 209.66 / NRRL 28638) TaxID=796925 RepID=A0A137PE14_CONC2|nr:hypothetical protein CONCODRAFT_167611 [Conidiobolus coronatus NRRL 28638]|eukprot:KXN73248.1 hypothetical protein CONCODRAFT_167611 [Conidiobolus coronatus NRRL 28638]